MDLQHVNVKFFVEGELTIDLERVIESFHGWVANQVMPEMLIDVADYRHVPAGPSVVAVGHEADYGMDNRGDRLGLLYNRKAPLDGSNEERLQQAVDSAAKACMMLEEQFDGLKFSRQEFEIAINDRALAPNNDETQKQCQPLFASLAQKLGGDHELQFDRDPRRLFSAVVRTSDPIDFAGLA